jgi:hypothetical protein
MFGTYFVVGLLGLLALALAWAAGAGTGREHRQERATVRPVARFQLSVESARSRLETAG